VTVAGRPVNLLLVQQGLAWWYQQFARRDTQLRDAEAKARAGRVGLWADENPQPPWEFRKERRNR
jgi:endonuclease YncB( thermonuclease family)